MSEVIDKIRQDLLNQADPARAILSSRYFKSETLLGDEFLGVTVPKQRVITRQYSNKISPYEVLDLLHSKIHEERLTALMIWVLQFKKGDKDIKKSIYDLYLKNTSWINNWDLVDVSSRDIVGGYIFDKDHTILDKLSVSKSVWDRRIAIIATSYFIQFGDFDWTLKLAEQYLNDSHHYIHKASGWMLREIGKRDELLLCDFLDKNAAKMPRVMLRYAIERLPETVRKAYLLKK